MSGTIRLATTDDAEQIQSIYAPVVRDTAISFELEAPSVAEMASRIRKTLDAELPWLVFEEHHAADAERAHGISTDTPNSKILGYVYAGKHRGDRPAYEWSVEVSIYMHADARGKGLGRKLYTALFSVLAFQHIQNAYAGATLPNAASVAIHENFGFKRVGVYEEVGYKLGKWHDTIWWVKRLGAHAVPAPAIIPLSEAIGMDGFPVPLVIS